MSFALLISAIALPYICAILIYVLPAFKKEKLRNAFVSVSLVLPLLLIIALCLRPDYSSSVYLLAGVIPISFMVDATAKMFALLSASMCLIAGIYAQGYFHNDNKAHSFFTFYLGTLGSIIGVCFAGTAVTLYLFFEFMTLVSVGLVMYNRDKKAISGGIKYLLYSIVGAMMGLFGIFYFSIGSQTAVFTAGGIVSQEYLASNPLLAQWALLIMIVGFGAKAGMFPMHSWLPSAHPVAPSPASAILSAVVTKMGVLSILRMIFFVVGPAFLLGSWMQTTLLILSLMTVFMGSMMALRTNELKKRLAYSSVSQVSYILFGMFMLNGVALQGAMLHVIFHSVMKTLLFLGAGAIIHQTHQTYVRDLHGIGAKMPITLWCFTIAGVSLVGIPPMSGFLSKYTIARGAMLSNIAVFDWFGPAMLLLSALLTAFYLIPIGVEAFYSKKEPLQSVAQAKEVPAIMRWPMIVLAALCVLLGLFASPALSLTQFALRLLIP